MATQDEQDEILELDLPVELAEKVQKLCARRNLTLTEFVQAALTEKMERDTLWCISLN